MALAIPRHEFIVTYEGPIHPSSSDVPSASSNRQSLCLTLPQTGLDKISNTSYVTQVDLLSSISQKIGWPAYLLCIANRIANQQYTNDNKLYPTHTLQNNNNNLYQHEPLTIKISPKYTSIRGGKGGFGTLLKGQSKQAGARTTLDFGACRDLSGRRLRHVNDEIKLRKWKELQAARDRAAKSGNNEEVDELSALKTASGIRNWHLMVPSWSDAAAFSKKGKRKMERQYEREVRGRQSKEDKVKSAKEQKRLDEEWAVMEYVRRGEEEGKRVMGDSVKEGILAHMRKRKQESKEQQDDVKEAAVPEEGATVTLVSGENSLAAHFMTLSGDMSVFDAPESNKNKKPSSTDNTPKQSSTKLRIQSQSDFATAVVLLNVDKLKDISSNNNQKNGVYVEYTIQTSGLAQIGWIRSPEGNTSTGSSGITFIPNSDTGDGVGDDNASYGYDGSRFLKFHGGKEDAYGSSETAWKSGDVLGCYCKLTSDGMEVGYSINGKDLGVAFTDSNTGDRFSYYPAVSLNLNETVDVNIGPDFAYEVKKGCIGAYELVKTETDVDASGDDDDNKLQENSKKQLTAVDNNAPPKKRPRDESAAAKKTTNQVIKQSEEAEETFGLNKCSSIDELKQMEPDRLKNILLSMGVKCGGTPDDRANRLFSLKGLRRDEYPKKVRGKNFIP